MPLVNVRRRSSICIGFKKTFFAYARLFVGAVILAIIFGYLAFRVSYNATISAIRLKRIEEERVINNTYTVFMQSNRTLCSHQSNQRGPHQKVIAISVYGPSSNYTDNPLFSWSTIIITYIEQLSSEVQTQLPGWIIRIYIDFDGSNASQRGLLSNLSNVDVCDIKSVHIPGHESLMTHLPGKMWRFLPIFDPMVDFILSRDLDSPIIRREAETIELWLSTSSEGKIFHIARDHMQHGVPILGGLWGAAPVRDRYFLYRIFKPMLNSSIARQYSGTGDQSFLSNFIWPRVKDRALIFDSFSCAQYGGQPFLSKRPPGNCFLGCLRPCCDALMDKKIGELFTDQCPTRCRPKNHQDWIFC